MKLPVPIVRALSCALALTASCDSGGMAGTARLRPRSAADASDEPPAAWQAQVRERMLSAEYAIQRSEHDNERSPFRAFNRAHGLNVAFDASGAELRSSADSSGSIRIGGVSVGREHAAAAVDLAPGELSLGPCSASGERDMDGRCLQLLERRAGAVTEQWENRADGLEQTLVVKTAPAGQGRLVARIAVDAAQVEVSDDGQHATLIAAAGGLSLGYSRLKVWDAGGKTLPARMQAAPGGIALLVDDRDARYPVTIDPVLGTNWAWFKFGATSANFGLAVASAGHFNRDLYGDVVVGAPDTGGGNGAVYVYYGELGGLALNPAYSFYGANGARLGAAVSALDADNNGNNDLLVGAPGLNRAILIPFTGQGPGTLVVIQPSDAGTSPAFGYSVARAGDVNGDGYEDMVIGAPWADGSFTDDGAFYMIYGTRPLPVLITPTAFLRGGQASSRYGYSVAGGNFNGDAYDDVIIGAPFYDNGQVDEGLAFVYHGSATGLRTQLASRMEPNEQRSYLGGAVASAGDTNGDGYDDAIIGAVGINHGGVDRGCAWVYRGSPTGLQEPTAANTLCGSQDSSQFGAAVASAGDVNGDGYADVLVGSPGYDNPPYTDAGRAYLFLGGASGPTAPAAWEQSPPYFFNFGQTLASAGDVNSDGLDDVLVQSRTANAQNPSGGEGDLFLYLAIHP